MPVPAARPNAALLVVALTAVTASAFAPVAVAAEGAGEIRIRPGQWETSSRIWLDGREVLSDLESASERATRDVLAQARAQMTPEEREEFDRTLPPRDSIVRDTECVTPAQSRMDAGAVLREALQAVHAEPWSCTFSHEQASSRGYYFEYDCRTAGGGRAQGNARTTVDGETAYTVVIEGRSHAVDNATGRPLEPRMLDTRLVAEGVWKAEQCMPGDEGAEDAEDGADGEDGEDSERG